jgi:hypothetical protein
MEPDPVRRGIRDLHAARAALFAGALVRRDGPTQVGLVLKRVGRSRGNDPPPRGRGGIQADL